jgi:Zn-dependent peptidase ImmA (M78 family)/transcriptional regulator with XRE-family HTH domain
MQKMRRHAAQSVEAAAKRAHATEAEFGEWEAGRADPPLSALRDLANLYNVPLSAFLLSNPLLPKPPTTERRVYRDGHEPETTPELAAALNRAVAMQEVARELLEEVQGPRFMPIGDATPAEQLAIAQREVLGVTLRQQLAWSDAYDALNGWRTAVEAQGVFVMQYRMKGAHVRAFSLAEDPPVMVLHRSDAPRARAFSILHEYGHILLGTAGVCEPGTSRRAMETSEPERYCNLFAGAVMVPSEVLRADSDARAIGSLGDVPPDADIDKLVRRYQASRGVVWYRLQQVGLISLTVFNAKWDEWADYHGPAREGFAAQSHAEIAVRDFGPRLANLLYLASQSGVLPVADAAQYLRVPPETLPAVGEELAKRLGGSA